VDGEGQTGGLLGALGTGAAATALVLGRAELAREVARAVDDVRWVDTAGAPAEAWAPGVAAILAEAAPRVALGPDTAAGRVLMGAAAARLGAPLISRVLAARSADGEIEVEQADLDGRVIVTLSAHAPICGLVLASDESAPERAEPARPALVEAARVLIERTGLAAAPGAGAKIANAERVVAVGRGIGSKEFLAEAERLASAIGAELGCSMPLSDEGWLPSERYVGWSGQHIRPRLYLALGISGAPQHLAGIRNAKTIIAINNDPDAPIFRVADLGIVARVQDVVPELTRAFSRWSQ
jgi:electron transfer flavoprotein alpha subunit